MIAELPAFAGRRPKAAVHSKQKEANMSDNFVQRQLQCCYGREGEKRHSDKLREFRPLNERARILGSLQEFIFLVELACMAHCLKWRI
jgi:hypothetical protein